MENKRDQAQAKRQDLNEKMMNLISRQNSMSKEINELRTELRKLNSAEPEISKVVTSSPVEKEIISQPEEIQTPYYNKSEELLKKNQIKHSDSKTKKTPKKQINLEKFIGENLINKLGIIITVIGVAIGAKYSIENELFSDLTRIILGYLPGILLLALGLKLKKNYENYSAALVSGAIAIKYFITYSAYSFYNLIPLPFAFGFMGILTAFAVLAAISYNRQVIAHIGLVGAYAVPFILKDGSDNIPILFSYMAIINLGIAVISLKKYWKALFYSAFGITWMIYLIWFGRDYTTAEHFRFALPFISIFFLTFYLAFLGYKLLQKEKFKADDILLLLVNSFVFFGIGYTLLKMHPTGKDLLGLFSVVNAVIHFLVGLVIHIQKQVDRNLQHFVIGLVLVFVAIAIPVQLDGNWVTLLWVAQAALLFWIGRTKNIPFYEKFSYPIMLLAFFSICNDWNLGYNGYFVDNPATRVTPILNINLLSSLLFVAAFWFINFLNLNKKYASAFISNLGLRRVISISIPAILLISMYYSFRMEIISYWNQLYTDSIHQVYMENMDYAQKVRNMDLKLFRDIWLFNYTFVFLSALALVNFKKFQDNILGVVNISFIWLSNIFFLLFGLYSLSRLRTSYLQESLLKHFEHGIFNIGIRYITLALVAVSLYICYKYVHQNFIKPNFRKAYDFIMHLCVLWIASSELLSWLDIAGFSQNYKLGLSILWGVYALFLVVLGIKQSKKRLRVGAIVIFTITLIKLFFYDISHLNTMSKTIVFISLGALLLIISFLYNKHRNAINYDYKD